MYKHCVSTPRLRHLTMDAPLAGRAGRHTGTATTLALTSFPIVNPSFNCQLQGEQAFPILHGRLDLGVLYLHLEG